MTSTDLHPINGDLLRHNRRVMAARIGWPDGALHACDQLEAAYPDWIPSWQPASTIPGFERPAGYYASRRRRHGNEPSAYGADPLELAAAIEAWTWTDWWHPARPS